MKGFLDFQNFKDIVDQAPNRAEGCRRVVAIFREGLKQKKFDITNVSFNRLGIALGAINPLSYGSGLEQALVVDRPFSEAVKRGDGALFSESAGAGVTTNALKVITSELLGREVIEGYESTAGRADDLVRTLANQTVTNQKLAGFTALGDPAKVDENHPYPESGFSDKYVTTSEDKHGMILSISMEAIKLDQTGQVQDRARGVGMKLRDYRERLIMDAVIGVTNCYRPQGVAETLYSAANMNLIGTGGVSGYTSVVPLTDWTSISTVRTMRATKVTDDRTDGSPAQPIGSINTGENILLVPESLYGTAANIYNQTMGRQITGSGTIVTEFARNPMSGLIKDVIASPYLDNNSATSWYYGDPKRQFVWTELDAIRLFFQGADSDAAFDRDTEFRVKARFWGGISAKDSIYFTKILGA